MKSILYTWMFFQLLLNSKFGSDQSTQGILSYIIGKSIVMRILLELWESVSLTSVHPNAQQCILGIEVKLLRAAIYGTVKVIAEAAMEENMKYR